jgi:hypothetical protein
VIWEVSSPKVLVRKGIFISQSKIERRVTILQGFLTWINLNKTRNKRKGGHM